MVGRTPEYLGKKIEAREMKLAMLYVLIFPLVILGFTAWAAVAPYGVSLAQQRRARTASREILYAFTERRGQQRLGLRRPQRQHAVLEHRRSASPCSSGAS